MRILHVPSAYPPVIGGAEYHCQKISEALAAKGHDVTVVTANVGSHLDYYNGPSRPLATGAYFANGVLVRRIKLYTKAEWVLYRGLSILVPQSLFRRLWARYRRRCIQNYHDHLAEEIRESNCDVVMTMPHSMVNVQCVASILCDQATPLVMLPMLHDDWPREHRSWYTGALKRANAVIANTSAEASLLAKEFGVPASKIFVGWLGVDLPKCNFDDNPTRSRQVLFVGRIVKLKNIPLLVAAMVLLWSQIEYSDVKLIIAGARSEDSAEIIEQIQMMAGSHAAKIIVQYDISDDQKQRLFQVSNCLVLPSLSESFGLVLIEAMAFRTPVVTMSIPVFASFIENGKTGILVDGDRPDRMANAIQLLLKDKVVSERIGRAGEQLVKSKFQWNLVADTYLAAYEHATKTILA